MLSNGALVSTQLPGAHSHLAGGQGVLIRQSRAQPGGLTRAEPSKQHFGDRLVC
jgi:hypothetical protein